MTNLTCDYIKEKSKPWACSVDGETIADIQEVLSEYPDELRIGHTYIGLTTPGSCKFNKKDSVLVCGMDHSLKMSDRGELIVIKKMDDMVMGQTFVGNKLNPRLWARKVIVTHEETTINPFSFKVANDVLTKDEWKRKEAIMIDTGGTGGLVYDVEKYHIIKRPAHGFDNEYKFKNGKIKPGVAMEKSTIDPHYQKKWTLFEALREWIANAHDVTKEVQDTRFYKDEDGNWVIEYDTDAVLKLKHLLVLGSHESKKGKLTIGQFGEGITLGSLVLARIGIPMKIEAIGKTYYPELIHNETFESPLLHAYYTENQRTYGTKLTFIGIPDEIMEEAKHAFLFNREGEYDIIHEREKQGKLIEFHDGEKRIAVRDLIIKGPKAKTLKHCFSYNFYDEEEELMNRDRDIVSTYDMKQKMRGILNSLPRGKEHLIKKILEVYSENKTENFDDLNQNLRPDSEVFEDWKEVLKEFIMDKYGTEKIAIKASLKWADDNVQNMGYELLDWGDSGNHLLEYFKYKTADKIQGAEGNPTVMSLTDLTVDKQKNFLHAINNVRAILTDYYKEKDPNQHLQDIFVAETFEGCKERAEHNRDILRGLIGGDSDCGSDILKGMRRNDKIYIHQSHLTDPAKATGTLIHETLHRYKDVEDSTRPFENEFTGLSGFTTNEWTGHRELFKKSIDVLKDNKRYIPSGALERKYPEMLRYLE